MRRMIIDGRRMKSGETGAMRDAGIVKHFDIASYERLRLFAEMIGLTEVQTLPNANCKKEKLAHEERLNKKVL